MWTFFEPHLPEIADGRLPVGPEPNTDACESRFAVPVGERGWLQAGRVDALYYIPMGYEASRKHPVVQIFHDQYEHPGAVLNLSRFEEFADEHGVVLLLPRDSTVLSPWKRKMVPIAKASLRALKPYACIDEDAVFGVGIGRGGRMLEELACEIPGVRAIASSGWRTSDTHRSRRCAKRTPFLHTEGIHDPMLPVGGGTPVRVRRQSGRGVPGSTRRLLAGNGKDVRQRRNRPKRWARAV